MEVCFRLGGRRDKKVHGVAIIMHLLLVQPIAICNSKSSGCEVYDLSLIQLRLNLILRCA